MSIEKGFQHDSSVAFIGGGHMACALIAGLLRSGWSAAQITVVEPDEGQRGRLSGQFGVRILPAADDVLRDACAIVWAVKPQVLAAAAEPVLDHLRSPLHISIAAGIATATLSRWLRSDRVVRAMPNTPALVGSGVTGMFAAQGVTPADRDLVQAVFAATGYAFWVDSDERIDAVTAISGSGPGYVFQFLASFQEAAQALGFSSDRARELVLRTVAGAVDQSRRDDTPFTTLRDRVASKGGTTEAGLRVLAGRNFSPAVCDAAHAAFARAQELSGLLSRGA